jgi:hypothetical protein
MITQHVRNRYFVYVVMRSGLVWSVVFLSPDDQSCFIGCVQSWIDDIKLTHNNYIHDTIFVNMPGIFGYETNVISFNTKEIELFFPVTKSIIN